jgi:hypothetical protein
MDYYFCESGVNILQVEPPLDCARGPRSRAACTEHSRSESRRPHSIISFQRMIHIFSNQNRSIKQNANKEFINFIAHLVLNNK